MYLGVKGEVEMPATTLANSAELLGSRGTNVPSAMYSSMVATSYFAD
jgi:hypothetical protein